MLPTRSAEPSTKLTKEPKKAKTVPIENTEDGIVLYADAGARPNPGFGGWGVHGYVYSTNLPKKGNGNAGYKTTQNGYKTKAEPGVEVTPLLYVDAFGTIPHITNNGGEIMAATEGFLYANRYPVSKATLFTDSSYVVKGITEHMPKWAANDWIKSDGQPVANKTEWIDLKTQLDLLRSKNVTVKAEWIKAHNGHQGNETADKYATIGVLQSASGKKFSCIETTKAEGYWSGPEEKNPLITHRRCYFTTGLAHHTPGEYFLGEHSKDDDVCGNRSADGSYAYVVLNTPDPYIELVRSRHIELATTEDALIMARLDRLYRVDMRSDLMRFGNAVLHQPRAHRLDLYAIGDYEKNLKGKPINDPVTKELTPIRLAMRAVDAVNTLKGVYLKLKAGDTCDFSITNITEHVYDIVEAKGVISSALNHRFDSTLTELAVSVKSQLAHLPSVDINLTLGLDLPERNTLKRLEKSNTTISVVTWCESPQAIRYVTYITTELGSGVWAGYYTNTKYLPGVSTPT